MPRTTHTTVNLEVTGTTFEEIKLLLTLAGYGHVFESDKDYGTRINMQGIALVKSPGENLVAVKQGEDVEEFWEGHRDATEGKPRRPAKAEYIDDDHEPYHLGYTAGVMRKGGCGR